MKRFVLQAIIFSIILFITYGTVQNPFTTHYVTELKMMDEAIPVVKMNNNELLEKIKLEASNYEISPQNARIDKVWKAIPGLEGRKVNIEASYENMKADGQFSERKLVYDTVKPEVTLDDLPPAPVYKGHPEKQMVSFVINVAWGNEYLPTILKTLKENGVHATFFLEGRWVKNYPELAKMIVDHGHEVGNHSYTHADFKIISTSNMHHELSKTNDVIRAVTGQTPLWFAPPSGSYRDEAIAIASEHGMRTIMWSVDTIDWKEPNPREMVQRIAAKAHPGALILMHPTNATATGMEDMIQAIKKKGYKIDTVSKLLNEERL